MPHLIGRFSLPAFPADRHIGFLSLSRDSLALGAILASSAITGIYSLPANADELREQPPVIASQSYTAPLVGVQGVVRDPFLITQYSVVQWPVPGSTRISSWFGYRSCAGCSSDHQGIDFNPGAGTPVEAIADGVVSQTGNPSGALGVFVVIDHVIDGEQVSSLYAHLQYGSMNLAVGDAVEAGDVIGRVGDTGESTGPHLHFGILVGGEPINPYPWMIARVNS